MMTTDITAQRGTRVSASRPSALGYTCVPSAHSSALAPFGDRTSAGVRVDGDVTAPGLSAWSPPI